jgi:hypothetical protein
MWTHCADPEGHSNMNENAREINLGLILISFHPKASKVPNPDTVLSRVEGRMRSGAYVLLIYPRGSQPEGVVGVGSAEGGKTRVQCGGSMADETIVRVAEINRFP